MLEYKSETQKKKFYKSSDWSGVNGLRNQALKRDNYECQQCKAEGKVHIDSTKVEGERKSIQLNVHHIKEIETHPELALDLDNLQTICLDHHNKQHNRFQASTNKFRSLNPFIWPMNLNILLFVQMVIKWLSLRTIRFI